MPRTLYAVASERFDRTLGMWIPEGVDHLLAESTAQARDHFKRNPANRGLRIVAVGPAVGVFGRESKDGKLILFT